MEFLDEHVEQDLGVDGIQSRVPVFSLLLMTVGDSMLKVELSILAQCSWCGDLSKPPAGGINTGAGNLEGLSCVPQAINWQRNSSYARKVLIGILT